MLQIKPALRMKLQSKIVSVIVFLYCFLITLSACQQADLTEALPNADPYVIVLGIAQDAGFPQAACSKACCTAVWEGLETTKMVSCLGIVVPKHKQLFLLDATPDFREQWQLLRKELKDSLLTQPSGIFLTHAHMGHYTGLLELGREAMGAGRVPTYAMPAMDTFLRTNGPWSQLVALENIELRPLQSDSSIRLNDLLQITPFRVPHRDEFSETVGYKIEGPNKKLLFIPDIDKWQRWNRSIITEVAAVDYAFLDATFFQNGELPSRDMSQIPHPFVEETMSLFTNAPASEKNKVHFIHLNHTNPLLQSETQAHKLLQKEGFRIAKEGQRIPL